MKNYEQISHFSQNSLLTDQSKECWSLDNEYIMASSFLKKKRRVERREYSQLLIIIMLTYENFVAGEYSLKLYCLDFGGRGY